MSFIDNIPKQLAELRIKATELRANRDYMFHDCGCEYCDYDGLKDAYSQKDVSIIDKELKNLETTFARLKRYAVDKGVDISEESIRAAEKELRTSRSITI